jgi:predicted  nucleic acid-binding Zn-ribbon protein
MGAWSFIQSLASFIANLLTILASGIAIWLFFTKASEIKTAFRLLLNWSFQLTLTDLKSKIERLNEYSAKKPEELEEIRNILHEIAGQMRGNEQIVQSSNELITKIEKLASSKNLDEPRKRSIISEIREVLRNMQVNSVASPLE